MRPMRCQILTFVRIQKMDKTAPDMDYTQLMVAQFEGKGNKLRKTSNSEENYSFKKRCLCNWDFKIKQYILRKILPSKMYYLAV